MKNIKRIFSKTQFLSLCIISILIFMSLSIFHIEKIYNTMMIANNFKTVNSVNFDFSEKEFGLENIEDFLKKVQVNKNIILTHDGGKEFYPGASSFGIYFNSMYKNEYNILKGRFFTKDDFENHHNKVVVGKNLVNYIEKEKGSEYIYRGKDKFLVIGIMGEKDRETQYDSRILYNLSADVNKNDEQYLVKRWILDSMIKSKDSLKESLRNVDKNSKGNIRIIEESKSVNPLVSAISNSRFILTNFSLVILCIILSLIKATSYFVDKIKLEIGVRKMYGASNRKIAFYIIKNYLQVSLISLVISFIVEKILVYLGILKVQYNITILINLLFSLIFVFIIGIIVMAIAMIKINRIEINELIKGRV